ncbi:MAG: DUF1848 family protein [Proteobacteria bacterium]|nr:DUF1848 family protein [Pseudomonadota bacterium]
MSRSNLIGITERTDPTANLNWRSWVKEGKPAILITKRPDILVSMIDNKDNIIVHCTITGLGNTLVEPHIPPPWSGPLDGYHSLCRKLGKDKVVLRIDPIIPNMEPLMLSLEDLTKEAEGRIRISFMDLYPHVQARFNRAGIKLPYTEFHAPFKDRYRIWKELGEPEVCSEPGLPSIPCISEEDCKVLRVTPSTRRKEQRYLCNCLANKTELLPNSPKCLYGCLYCYWKDGI